MKKVLAMLVALSLTFGSVALPAAESGLYFGNTIRAGAEEPEGMFEYNSCSDGTVEITGYWGSSQDLVIPATISGKKVSMIGFRKINRVNAIIAKFLTILKLQPNRATLRSDLTQAVR